MHKKYWSPDTIRLILFWILANVIIFAIVIVLIGLLILVFYLPGFFFPSIHFDYLVINALRLLLIWGLIGVIYLIAKRSYFEKLHFKPSLTKITFFSLLILIVLIIAVVSIFIEDIGITERLLNSYSNTFRIERIILTFFYLFIPSFVGIYSAYIEIRDEQKKRNEEEFSQNQNNPNNLDEKRRLELKQDIKERIERLSKISDDDKGLPANTSE